MRRPSSLCGLIVAMGAGFLVGLGVAAYPLEGAAAHPLDGLEPGCWMELSLNTVDDVDPCPDNNCGYSAYEGVSAVMNAWCGGAFATEWGKLGGLVVFGGGHKAYHGNEVYVFDVETQLWARVSDPYPTWDCDPGLGSFPDGSPCPPHDYDFIDYDVSSHSLVVLDSETNDMGGYYSGYPYLFDLSSLTWSRGPRRPGTGASTGASSAYDSQRRIFWMLPAYNQNLVTYDPRGNGGAGDWASYTNYNIEIDAVASIDPDHDLYVVLDNRSANAVRVFDLNNPNAGPITVSTQGPSEPKEYGKPGFDWDPVLHRFVIWTQGTSVFTLTPPADDWATGTWEFAEIVAAGTNTVTPSAPNSNGTYSRFRYVPSKNVYLLVNRTHEPVYAYRLTTDEGFLPEPPTDLRIKK